MVLISRLAVVLVVTGATFFTVRDDGRESVTGHPEALWDSSVEQVDAMISDQTQTTVSDSLTDSMTYAEDFGDDVSDMAD
jgi:hypothetical protein